MKKSAIIICFSLVVVVFLSFLLTNISSVRAAINWTQTDWLGGWGQMTWSDDAKYNEEDGINTFVAGQATLNPGTFTTAYGGLGYEGIWSLRATADGGMIMAGFTNSSGAGGYDGLIIKLDNLGNILWEKTYGGAGNDYFYNMWVTSDGGYVASGMTDSFGDTTDIWVVKVEDSFGDILWQESFNNSSTLTSFDYSTSVIENTDGNYVVLNNTRLTAVTSSYDLWIMELDGSSGSIIWQKIYGGANYDISNTPDLIKQTLDGGYIVACDSRSFSSGSDLLVFKIDSTGDNILWQNVYNGIGGGASATIVLSDGSYLIGGDVNSFGAGSFDWWILHLDSSGNILWQETFGGGQSDGNVNAIQTSDGNFFLAGNANSGSFGNGDIWAMKINILGNVLWQKEYGGTQQEQFYGMPQEMSDGTVVLGAYSQSFGVGSSDNLILKIAQDGTIYDSDLSIQDLDVDPIAGEGVESPSTLNISTPTDAPNITSITPSAIALTSTPLPSFGGDNYIRNGVLTSSIFDAGTINSWGPLSYVADVPENTAISFEISTDDGLSWEPVTDYITQTFGPSQTIAYRANLSSTDGLSTPILQEVSLDGSEAPVILTSPASGIKKTEATLNGNIIGIGGAAVTVRGFEYGLTDSYGTTVSKSDGPYGTGVFFEEISNLFCEKTYHYRAYATNSLGTGYGSDITFTTSSCGSIGGGGGGDGETTCQDHNATNYGGTLPCTYPSTTCQDTTATNYGGLLPCVYTVVNPIVYLVASPTNIVEGESSTLAWMSANAAFCSAPWTISTATSGSQRMYLTQTTNYSITCSGVAGTTPASSSATVRVIKAPILCQNTTATNYGDPLPCLYPIVEPPAVTLCQDEKATNFGELLPCVYSRPEAFCEDKNATNFQDALPCVYPVIADVPPKDAREFTEKIITNVREFINNPTTKAIKNVAIAVPVAASLLALLASLLSGVPLLNYLAYLFIITSQFLGFRRVPKPWGVVYDSYTKRPIPFARVEVLNEQARKLQSTITDANGRYGFLISAQTPNVSLQAFRTKYDFPSTREPSVIEQKLYPSIYKGGTVNASAGITNYDLPMDPRDKTASRNFYFGISSIKLNNVLTKVANILFILGAILGATNAIVNPNLTSLSIVAIILLTVILRSSGFKLKPFGLTKDLETDKALPFSFIALHNQAGERMNFTVSDDVGRYFLLTSKGNYLLKAYTPSFVPAIRTKEIPVSARNGWISKEVKI